MAWGWSVRTICVTLWFVRLFALHNRFTPTTCYHTKTRLPHSIAVWLVCFPLCCKCTIAVVVTSFLGYVCCCWWWWWRWWYSLCITSPAAFLTFRSWIASRHIGILTVAEIASISSWLLHLPLSSLRSCSFTHLLIHSIDRSIDWFILTVHNESASWLMQWTEFISYFFYVWLKSLTPVLFLLWKRKPNPLHTNFF